MKNEYRRPELIEYGRIGELTLGATGNHLDGLSIDIQGDIGCSNNDPCQGITGS